MNAMNEDIMPFDFNENEPVDVIQRVSRDYERPLRVFLRPGLADAWLRLSVELKAIQGVSRVRPIWVSAGGSIIGVYLDVRLSAASYDSITFGMEWSDPTMLFDERCREAIFVSVESKVRSALRRLAAPAGHPTP